jgi:hypothetical protein
MKYSLERSSKASPFSFLLSGIKASLKSFQLLILLKMLDIFIDYKNTKNLILNYRLCG